MTRIEFAPTILRQYALLADGEGARWSGRVAGQ